MTTPSALTQEVAATQEIAATNVPAITPTHDVVRTRHDLDLVLADRLEARYARTSQCDAPWKKFNADDYFQENYGEKVLTVDAQILQSLIDFYREVPADARVIDVGTGPNLYPLLGAFNGQRHITAIEYSPQNLRFLIDTQCEMMETGELPEAWQRFWDIAVERDSSRAAIDPARELLENVSVRPGSIFDLPEHRFDVATMFFCVESITEDQGEFKKGLQSFLSSVRDGGQVFAAFMEGSNGYDSPGTHFPAVSITEQDIKQALIDIYGFLPEDLRIYHPESEEKVRDGYHGMLILEGRVPPVPDRVVSFQDCWIGDVIDGADDLCIQCGECDEPIVRTLQRVFPHAQFVETFSPADVEHIAAEVLVPLLENMNCLTHADDGSLIFSYQHSNPKLRRVGLRDISGAWSPAALRAAAILKIGYGKTHLVIAPKSEKSIEDQAWAILQHLQIKPEDYNDVYIDAAADRERIAEQIGAKFEEALAFYARR